MKVTHDFTFIESEVIVTALKEYSKSMIKDGNINRSVVCDLMANLFSRLWKEVFN